MYLAVASTIVGQALVLGRPGLLVYAVVFCVAVATFVHAYEEPTLAARYAGRVARAAVAAAAPGHHEPSTTVNAVSPAVIRLVEPSPAQRASL